MIGTGPQLRLLDTETPIIKSYMVVGADTEYIFFAVRSIVGRSQGPNVVRLCVEAAIW